MSTDTLASWRGCGASFRAFLYACRATRCSADEHSILACEAFASLGLTVAQWRAVHLSAVQVGL